MTRRLDPKTSLAKSIQRRSPVAVELGADLGIAQLAIATRTVSGPRTENVRF